MRRPTIGALTPVLLPKKGMSGKIIPKPMRSMRTTRNKIKREDFLEAVVLVIDFLLPFKSMLRNKLYSILLLSFTSVFAQIDYAHAERVYGQIEAPRFKVGRLALKYEMDRFQANNNFDVKGDKRDILGDFEAYNAYLGVENDLSLKWSTSFGVQLGMSDSRLSGVSRQSTDLKGLQFGVSRVINYGGDKPSKDFKLIADFKYFLSLYSNNFGSDEVSVGDGSSWAQAGLWYGTDKFEHMRLWLYGGVNWPLKSFSKNFVFLARPEFKLGSGRLGVGVEGQIPFLDDSDADEPTTRLRLADEYNGGSFYYQPVNSEFVAANIWFGFEPAPLTEIKVGVGNVIYGRSAAEGLRVFVALEFSFSVSRSGYTFPYVKIKRGESKIQKNDGVRRIKNYAKPKKNM